ncbi:hypothetical protein GCM10011575_30480 [Microlunatus endophyticus]|uniref:Restriction endonuclease n=1 Tax=Microlunatus endophyticus TaxID=1716077 RepID=A0A917W6I3_9ACTN|nr:hypothetical protein [Microlunatus endophyticus]GGL69822.1 hypothetical protein GCM10011575_30480 [Microlunatus endophyticus]
MGGDPCAEERATLAACFNEALTVGTRLRDLLLVAAQGADPDVPGVPDTAERFDALQTRYGDVSKDLTLSQVRSLSDRAAELLRTTGRPLVGARQALSAVKDEVRLRGEWLTTYLWADEDDDSADWPEARHQAALYMISRLRLSGVDIVKARDGHVDVYARGAVARVKYLQRPLGVVDLLQMSMALGEARMLLVFSRGGFDSEVLDHAGQDKIALFSIHLPDDIQPANQVARRLVGGASASVLLSSG